MNNNSLIETGNSRKRLVLQRGVGGGGWVNFYFVDFLLFNYFYFYLRGVPQFKNIIKRQFVILAESLKNTLEGVFVSKVASLLTET